MKTGQVVLIDGTFRRAGAFKQGSIAMPEQLSFTEAEALGYPGLTTRNDPSIIPGYHI